MTTTPDVSIVIACYNAGATLAETIASIQRQSLRNWELICVDDGSTDNTPALLATAAVSDPRVHYIRQPNAGPASARNAGVKIARANHVFFIDADDLLLRPDALALLLSAAQNTDRNTIITAGTDLLDQHGRRLNVPQFPATADFSPARLLQGNPLISVLALVPRTLLGDDPFHNEMPPCEDWDLWLSLASRGARCLRLPRVLFGYRLHNNNSSRRIDVLHAAGCRVIRRWQHCALSGESLHNYLSQCALGAATLALAAGDEPAACRFMHDASNAPGANAHNLASRFHWAYAFTHGAAGETWRSNGDRWQNEIHHWLQTNHMVDSPNVVMSKLRALATDTDYQIKSVQRWLAQKPAIQRIVIYGIGTNGLKLLETLQSSLNTRRDAQNHPLAFAIADDHADELTTTTLALPREYPRTWRSWPRNTVAIVTPNEYCALTRALTAVGGLEDRDYLVLANIDTAAPVLAAQAE